MSNWISVEDELPDIDSLVVILDSNDTNPEYDFARSYLIVTGKPE